MPGSTPREPYKLPDADRTTFRAAAVRALVLYGLGVSLLAWILTQSLAWTYSYPDEFGEPYLPYDPAFRGPGLAAVAVLLGLAALVLALARDKKPGWFFLLLAPAASAVALGPIYQPFAFLGWIRSWAGAGVSAAPLSTLAPVAPGSTASALSDPPATSDLATWRLLEIVFWSAAAAGLIVLAIHLARTARGFRQKAHAHGSAAWAGAADIEAAGLFAPTGIVLGLWRERGKKPRYVRSSGPHHVFVQGPPRSGKGVGIVQPTLLSWPASVIVHDAKGELWSLTAGWRARELGSPCIRLDPTCPDKTAACYNPLFEIRRGPLEVADTQNLCDLLVDPQRVGESAGGSEQHFRDSAAELMVAAILHILYAERDKSLPGLVYFLSHPDRTKVQILKRMARAVHDRSEPWIDPPGDVERARPLMRLFLAQALRRLTQELAIESGRPVSRYRHELLLMLDEFPLLGRLAFFEKALAVMPGYGIRACLITQGLSQHRAVYAVAGRHESIVTTCDVRVALAANDFESAKYFSDLCGVFTVHQKKRSYRGGRVDLLRDRQVISQAEHQRALVYPDEILRLPDDDVLILARSTRPIRAERVKRYRDRALEARAAIAAPAATATLRTVGEWGRGS